LEVFKDRNEEEDESDDLELHHCFETILVYITIIKISIHLLKRSRSRRISINITCPRETKSFSFKELVVVRLFVFLNVFEEDLVVGDALDDLKDVGVELEGVLVDGAG